MAAILAITFWVFLISRSELVISKPVPLQQDLQVSIANDVSGAGFRVPTIRESTIQARRIFHLEGIGTLSTVFPGDDSKNEGARLGTTENRPPGLGGAPFGLFEYFADCEPDTGNPTLLQVDLATNFKNAAAGSNITLSIRWHPPSGHNFSAARLPRFALFGHLERLTTEEIERKEINKCFLSYHPDAYIWTPGNDIHDSRWTRFVVDYLYWFGGFGDRAYIGWIPAETWHSISTEEVEQCRLAGELNDLDGATSCPYNY